jgi:hypothetical protein
MPIRYILVTLHLHHKNVNLIGIALASIKYIKLFCFAKYYLQVLCRQVPQYYSFWAFVVVNC